MMQPLLLLRPRWVLVAAIFMASASVTRAQTPASCDTSYTRAEEAYYAADFERAVRLLRPCARKSSLPDSTRVRTYRLLSFVYLGQNDEGAARRAVESLLDLQPAYTPTPSEDRPDFVALVRKAKKARRKTAEADKNDRRWVRWGLGAVAATAAGAAAVLLLGDGGSGGGSEPLPRPQPPPE